MKHAVNFLTVVFCLAAGGVSAYAAPQDRLYVRTQENNMKGIDKLFEKAGANHDGVLTREETEKTPVLPNRFNDTDINQDGKVTRQEMVESIKMKRGTI